MGRRLRCFNPNWNMRLFRRGHGRMEDLELHDVPGTGDNEIHEHIKVDGVTGYLRTPLRHDDYRGLTAWLDRHNRYATWEAHLYRKFRREPIGVGPVEFLRLDPFQRKRVLRRVWVRLPLRSPIRFLVWYVARGGFLDGRPGFVFCVADELVRVHHRRQAARARSVMRAAAQAAASRFEEEDGIAVFPVESEHARAQAAHFDEEDDEFETERPRGTTPLYVWLIEEKFRRSIEGIGAYVVSGCTGLAVCAGSGMDAELLARAGAHVVSADISLGAARRARSARGGTGST